MDPNKFVLGRIFQFHWVELRWSTQTSFATKGSIEPFSVNALRYFRRGFLKVASTLKISNLQTCLMATVVITDLKS